jgi:hypothetical protein
VLDDTQHVTRKTFEVEGKRMKVITQLLVVVLFIGGWLMMPARVGSVQGPAPSYLALVAAGRGTGDLTMLTVTPTGANVFATIPTTGNSVEVAVAPNGQYALALNQGTMSIITGLDTPQPRESRVFSVGTGPNAVAITPDSASAIVLIGQDQPPKAVIIDGLPDAPVIRTRLDVPGGIPGVEMDIAIFASGDTAASSAGIGGLSLLDGLSTTMPSFRPGSPFTFAGSIQGLALAPDDTRAFAASILSSMFAVLAISGVQPGQTPSLTSASPVGSSTISSVRVTSDGSTVVAPGFAGIFILRVTEMGLALVKLVQVPNQQRAATQGGVAISPDGRLALVASLDTQQRTTLSIIHDVLSDDPTGTAQVEPSAMINTRERAQQSIAFVPLAIPPSFVREEEPNDSIEQADLIQPTVTILAGFDQAGDVDYFGFEAEAGRQLIIETRAQRLSPPSLADTVITLLDGQGNVLAENDDVGSTLDSRLELMVPATGRYFFRVRESRNKGGATFNYEAVVTVTP